GRRSGDLHAALEERARADAPEGRADRVLVRREQQRPARGPHQRVDPSDSQREIVMRKIAVLGFLVLGAWSVLGSWSVLGPSSPVHAQITGQTPVPTAAP